MSGDHRGGGGRKPVNAGGSAGDRERRTHGPAGAWILVPQSPAGDLWSASREPQDQHIGDNRHILAERFHFNQLSGESPRAMAG